MIPGGSLSNNWSEAQVRIHCYGFDGYVATNFSFQAAGVDSGQTILDGGVSYRLYTTTESDVFYIGKIVGWNKEYPFGADYNEAIFLVAGTGGVVSRAVKIRSLFHVKLYDTRYSHCWHSEFDQVAGS